MAPLYRDDAEVREMSVALCFVAFVVQLANVPEVRTAVTCLKLLPAVSIYKGCAPRVADAARFARARKNNKT